MKSNKKILTYVLIGVPVAVGIYFIVRNTNKKKEIASTPPKKGIFDEIRNWWENWDLRTY